MKLTPRRVRLFQEKILAYFRVHKRDLPWRETEDPYQILVSEIMLQQTQAERVVLKYHNFLAQFPTVQTLADAPVGEVLKAWQGLGYNRRALHLKRAALILSREHGGEVPRSFAALDALPGVGAYTASAVLAFAHNEPTVFIETNIRTVFLHHFFLTRRKVADTEILKLVKETLPTKDAREWYSALMDYGAMLKRTVGNPNVKSAQYAKQSRFKGSRRELRGEILRQALRGAVKETGAVDIFSDLVSEGFLQKKGSDFVLAS